MASSDSKSTTSNSSIFGGADTFIIGIIKNYSLNNGVSNEIMHL